MRQAVYHGLAPLRAEELDHHFASWFMMRGGGLLALKEILGHTDTKMIQRYAHLEPDHLRAEMTAAIPARISRP